MKTIFILSLLILLTVLTENSAEQSLNIQPAYSQVIPDIMNKLTRVDRDYKNSITYEVFSADTFPVFPGFPKAISGSTFEGGIYCNMDADPELEILYNIGFTVQAFNLDGSNVTGWPKTVSSYPLEGAPAFGDIDGDGQGEVVVVSRGTTSGGMIYAFKKNGSTVSGFPVNHGYTSRTPVLADLDNDGKLEIIVNKRLYPVGEVWVYSGTGVVYPGWPKAIGHVPASSAAVGDITGDNFPEIIMESYNMLYAWNRNGDSVPGFPFAMPNGDVNSYSSPVLADLDGDNIREIVFGTHVLGAGGYVYIVKNNGTIMSGWPKPTPYWIYSPPAVGFIDNDNILDIAIGDGGGTVSGSPVFKLYAWNRNGTALSGFPVYGLWAINNQPILGDIDNDNMTEIIIDDNTTQSGMGKYLAYNHNGTPVTGWPIATLGTTFFSTPMLLDVNLNGILDIAGSGTASSLTNVYLWNTGIVYNPNRVFNPMWQYNTRHNGVYGDNLLGIEPKISEVSKGFMLYQNYPNPFNPITKIKYQIAKSHIKNQNVKLVIYNSLGQEIQVLVNQAQEPGTYEVEFDGTLYPSGVYYYTLYTVGYRKTKSMVLLK